LCVTAIAVGAAAVSHADWFGNGENAFEIPFVTIGEPGNPPDLDNATNPNFNSRPNPSGSVGYE
jgi:hypothetical protein